MGLIKTYESEQLLKLCLSTRESICRLKRIPENILPLEAMCHVNDAIAKLEAELAERTMAYENKRDMEQREFFDSLDVRTKDKLTIRSLHKYHPSDLPWGWSLD